MVRDNLRRLPVLLAASLAFYCLLGGVSAHAGVVEPRLQSSLRKLVPSEEVAVIIHLGRKAAPAEISGRNRGDRRSKIIRSLRETSELSQRSLRAHLKGRNAKQVHPLWIVNGIAAKVRMDEVAALASLPGVERVVLDATVHATEPVVGALAAPEWNLSAIHAPDLWALGFKGQGTVVAHMDTGVDLDHPDLLGRWRGGTNSWFDPHNQHPLTPYDALGHGTQTMGLMVGGDAGGTTVGVAPDAQWIAVKLFNDAGETTYSIIHQGFQWLLDPDGDPDTDDAPDVVNHSWGLIDTNHACVLEFQSDVQVLKNADIAMSFSAGNDGPSAATSVSPANYPESFSVGSVDSTNTVASSSSRGPSACFGDVYPLVIAPGVNVRTTDLYHLGIPDAYVAVSGTSFAAPHVSGAMALLRSAFPSVGAAKLEQAFIRSASDLGVSGPDNDYGNGLIDAAGAYRLLLRHDIGVYRQGAWYRDVNENMAWDAGQDGVVSFGGAGDISVTGDWDGDGVTDVGVFFGNGIWRLDTNGNGLWEPGVDAEFRFGITGDIPVTGDWNSDGVTDVGVFRGGLWALDANGTRTWNAGDVSFRFGITGDSPVTGDWNGDSVTDVGVFRESGLWALDANGTRTWDAGDVSFRFGMAGDIPVTGDWNSDGVTDAGVFRGGGYWFLDTDGSKSWNAGDGEFRFGMSGDRPVVGRW